MRIPEFAGGLLAWRKSLMTRIRALVVTALLIASFTLSTHSQSASSQSPATAAAQEAVDQSLQAMEAAGVKMSFDAASVKINDSGSSRGEHSNVPLGPGAPFTRTGGLFDAANEPFTQIFAWAFDLSGDQQLGAFSQLPKWALAERLDIEAKVQGNPSKAQMELMMQSLLGDRFKLAIHTEPKEGPIYALEMVKPGKLGPQLKPHVEDPSCAAAARLPAENGVAPQSTPGQAPPGCGSGLVPTRGSVPGTVRYDGEDVPVSIIAKYLPLTSGYTGIDRPVIDRTGLTGNYDFSLQFSPQSAAAPSPEASPDTGPTVLEALRDQLGLKLEPTTGTVNVIFIDHIEEPTPN